MEYLISIILSLLELFSIDIFINSFFVSKVNPHLKHAIFLLFSALTTIFLFFNNPHPFLKYFFSISLTLFLFFIIYRIKIIHTFTIYVIWFALYYTIDCFSTSIYLYILSLSFDYWQSSFFHFTVSTIVSRIFLCIISYLFKSWYKKYYSSEYITYKEWLLLSIYPIATFLYFSTSIRPAIINNSITSSLLFISIFFFISNFALLYLIGSFNQEHKEKQELLLINERAKENYKHYLELQNLYSKQRSIVHDYNNNLLTIKNILDIDDYTTAKRIVKSLTNSSTKNSLIVDCNNTIINSILNQKHAEAQSLNISVQYIINDLSNIKILDEDIITILSNALDNAITAASKSIEKLIYIRFTIIDGETIIQIKNTVRDNVIIVNNSAQTTKGNNITYGYGLKNITHTLKKYEHFFEISCENNLFELSIFFFQ